LVFNIQRLKSTHIYFCGSGSVFYDLYFNDLERKKEERRKKKEVRKRKTEKAIERRGV